MRWRVGVAGALAAAAAAMPAAGQGYRLRLDARYQAVSFRGVTLDSVASSLVTRSPTSGPVTPDGFAADCDAGTPGYCYFFRPGPSLRGQPLTTAADLTLWGFGVPGLTVRASGRVATDLATGTEWPGTEPAVILSEAFAEYTTRRLTGRLGRQTVAGRLGYQGFDGARAAFRFPKAGVEIAGYGGFGLARAVALPVTSPALNPLDDFQPFDRQLLVGADAAWRTRWFDLRTEYRREVDPEVDYFVSERAGVSTEIYPFPRFRVSGGAEYDFANGWWGTAEVGATYTDRRDYGTIEARRYRPFFDLWTIWGAFSPVPYRSVRGSVAVTPVAGLWLRGQGERYWFEDDAAETPLVSAEDRGWRAQVSATAAVTRALSLEAGLRSEFGPGASSRTIDGGLVFTPSDRLTLSARGGTLDRPLEFRYSDAKVTWLSAAGDARLNDHLRLVADLGWFGEDRRRPDAAAFNLDQLRISTRLVLTLGSGADRLPPAVRRTPAAGSRGDR